MLDIESLSDADMGRAVIYTDGTGQIEQGHITSWNKSFVFVDYGKSCGRGIATSPSDLVFMSG